MERCVGIGARRAERRRCAARIGLATGPHRRTRRAAARTQPMIRIHVIWRALGASDLRGRIDKRLALVGHGFALGAQSHHADVLANRRADRLKVLVYDGSGMWLCPRRLQAGSFAWPREEAGSLNLTQAAAPGALPTHCRRLAFLVHFKTPGAGQGGRDRQGDRLLAEQLDGAHALPGRWQCAHR